MDQEKLVSVTISLPQTYRDRLRRMAAQANLKNPERFTSISQLGREIICQHLEGIKLAKVPEQAGGMANE